MLDKNRSAKLTAADVLANYSEYPDFCDPLTDVNQIGTFGNRPLHLASYQGDLDAIVALVEAGAEVNVAGEMAETPLHEAAGQGHSEAVRFLLAHGTRLDVKNEFGHTPLDTADLHGHGDVVKLIRDATAARTKR